MLKSVRIAALAGAMLLAAQGAGAETVIKAVMHSPLRLTDPTPPRHTSRRGTAT